MNVRICPKCGSHNLENAWSCSGCGETLSLNTLVEIDGASIPDDLNAFIPESSISPYFYQDIAELFDTIVERDETVISGYNITQPSNKPPHLFGYLIMTSRRLISVLFECEISKLSLALSLIKPSFLNLINLFELRAELKRRCIQPEINSFIAVDYPEYPITPKEKASRRVEIDMLGDLINVGYLRQESLLGITLRFTNDGKIITFCAPKHARDIYKLLNHILPQINGEKKKMDQLEGVSPENWLRGMYLEGTEAEEYQSLVPEVDLAVDTWGRIIKTALSLEALFGGISGFIGVMVGGFATTIVLIMQAEARGYDADGMEYIFAVVCFWPFPFGIPLIGVLLGALGGILASSIFKRTAAALLIGFLIGGLVGIIAIIGFLDMQTILELWQ